MMKKIQKTFFGLEVIPFECLRETLAFTERQYISSGVNMLTKCLKISDTTKIEFLSWFSFWIIKKYDKNSAAQI